MKLQWDSIGERYFESGVSNAVLYSLIDLEFTNGVAWNGLINVSVNPAGADAFDGKLYRNDRLVGVAQGYPEYTGKITAYTYPDAFEPCIGYVELIPGMNVSQQEHSIFGLSYKTLIGNDVSGPDLGYKIHLIYNCLVEANEKTYDTVKESLDPLELSYDFETFAVDTTLDYPSSEIIFDSRKLTPEQLTTLEDILYGTEESEPRLPYPDELVEILKIDDELYPANDLYPGETDGSDLSDIAIEENAEGV
jgi:hypothetical protein